jgi:hypothetical protein
MDEERPRPIWNLPDPYDGPHCWLKRLVRAEAERSIEVTNALNVAAGSEPEEGEWEMRRAGVEAHLWTWLTSGWARVADDCSGLLFWNPFTLVFVPWTAELHLLYDQTSKDLKALREAAQKAEYELYIGRAKDGDKLPEMQEDSYVGGTSRLAPSEGAYTGKGRK